ncbi:MULTISPECIES: hypothetical protein [unclassified Enterococcus]|uniref:hypothetical protein n=1 Tax=unclassified Enterococcus TaxID=2608891 RepID=UPI001A914C07|nr:MULTISPECIES: hypothetical protein [unclassified Enterococcus]MBO0462803.1 hypothetical protein [Enterococcus sp. DIV1298c]MBO1300876.1 hypothetical protein [Enterococcus sp. DIV1271a]
MKRLKNIVESKEGKRIVIIASVIFITMFSFIFYSIFFHRGINGNSETTASSERLSLSEQREEELNLVEKNEALVYRGIWYSDRADGMVLELKSDGTYQSTSWLTTGQYRLVDTKLVLTDKEKEEVSFELMTRFGETIFFYEDNDGNTTYFYPNVDLREKAKEMADSGGEETHEMISQKWSDVLIQGSWSNTTMNSHVLIDFTEDTYVQRKMEDGKEITKIFSYRIISEDVSETLCVLELSVIDEHSAVNKFEITLEETPFGYRMYSLPGMFLWVNDYEKPQQAVRLTQTGVFRENNSSLDHLLENRLNG